MATIHGKNKITDILWKEESRLDLQLGVVAEPHGQDHGLWGWDLLNLNSGSPAY